MKIFSWMDALLICHWNNKFTMIIMDFYKMSRHLKSAWNFIKWLHQDQALLELHQFHRLPYSVSPVHVTRHSAHFQNLSWILFIIFSIESWKHTLLYNWISQQEEISQESKDFEKREDIFTSHAWSDRGIYRFQVLGRLIRLWFSCDEIS